MFFFFSSRRRHTRYWRDWSSDVCSSDLALLQETRLIHHQHPAVLLAQMFDDVFTQVVTHGVGIPASGVQEALRSLRSHLTHLFGELPAVLTFQASEKASEVAAGSLPDLRP